MRDWLEDVRIIDVTGGVSGGSQYREIDIECRMAYAVHRTEVGENADDIRYAYEGGSPEAAAVTGGRMPYTHVIRKDGTIEQAIPWTAIGPHARAWNLRSASVALVGDFRRHRPTGPQWSSLVMLCSVAAVLVGGAENIRAHDELACGSSDPEKECPGRYLDMADLREEVGDNLLALCHRSGMVW